MPPAVIFIKPNDSFSRILIGLGVSASAVAASYHTFLLAAIYSRKSSKKSDKARIAYHKGALYLPLACALASLSYFAAAHRTGQADFLKHGRPTVFMAGVAALTGIMQWTVLEAQDESSDESDSLQDIREGLLARTLLSVTSLLSGLLALGE